MLATKKRVCVPALMILALAGFICGCTPAGPRALQKGKKYFDRGDFADAAVQFQTATTLLATNASAWNYYGVTLQRTGQPNDAAEAYQRALALNRDLMEAHYNLGCLWLEQDKAEAAKAEFTTYTLRRPNQIDGWLKLGSAQLRSGELLPAERSFGTAYYLNTNNAEALNGLGLARVQRGRPREASQFFAAAIQKRPDYSAAYLNLATVAKEYLRDDDLALRNYRAYLQVAPNAANAGEVTALITQLNQQVAALTAPAPTVVAPVVTTQPTSAPPPTVSRPAAETPGHAVLANRNTPPAKTQPANTAPPVVITAPPPQVITVPPEPIIAANPSPTPAPASTGLNAKHQEATPPTTDVNADHKDGLWQKMNPTHWFGTSKKKYEQNGVTPLPTDAGSNGPAATPTTEKNSSPPPAIYVAPTTPTPAKSAILTVPATPNFPRYAYLSPSAPAAGNRPAAEDAFSKAHDFEGANHFADALQWYHQAAVNDPGWFTAQYETAVLAYRQKNYSLALRAFETALAIQADSADARYGFGITLKSAGYPIDAANELNKLAAVTPNDARVHLALGNIYAQQIHDVAKARSHYLKLLDLDPANAQASSIRFWLAANTP